MRQPLYVSIDGAASGQAPGALQFLLSFFKCLGLLAVFCFLWLLGSGVVKRISMQNLPQAGLTVSVRDKSQSLGPKQFVKEDLPEKSIKTFSDVKVTLSAAASHLPQSCNAVHTRLQALLTTHHSTLLSVVPTSHIRPGCGGLA